METTSLIVTILIALAGSLFGFRLNKILITLMGFAFGFSLGGFIATQIVDFSIAPLVLSLIVGFIVAVISFKLYVAGVFILCGFSTFIACYTFIDVEIVREVVAIVAGILVGIIGAKFTKPIMILSTSFSGGFLLVDSILQLLNFDNMVAAVIFGVIATVLAASFQFKNNKEVIE